MAADLTVTPVAKPLSAIAEQHVALAEHTASLACAIEIVDDQLAQITPALIELLSDAKDAGMPMPKINIGKPGGEEKEALLQVKKVRWTRRLAFGLRLPAGSEQMLTLTATAYDERLTHLLAMPTTIDRWARKTRRGDLVLPGAYRYHRVLSNGQRAAVAAALPRIIAELNASRVEQAKIAEAAITAVQSASEQLSA